jgi:general secretion pathway protein L
VAPTRDTLFIRWRSLASNAPLAAALWSPTGGLQILSGTLAEIAARAAGRPLVVFVPAADVRLTSITVPARSPQRVLQAAPFALEDQLAEDIEKLHFALGPRQTSGAHPIAIVSKSRMDTWLGTLAQAGLQPDAVVPEHLALPWSADDRIHLLAEPEEITARTAAFQGFSCPPAELGAYLKIADPDNRYGLRVLLTPDFQPDLTAIGRSVELLPGHRSALEVLVKHWGATLSINLLQGPYSAREKANRNWAPWRIPAALAAGWVIATLIAGGINAWRLNHEAAALDARNVARFQELFPDEQRIVDLGAQAEQKMTALKASGASQGLLKLLEPAAAAITAVPGLSVQTLQFRDGSLYLNLVGQDLQAVDTLQNWFAEHPGTRFERESANSGANGVQIRVKLTPA